MSWQSLMKIEGVLYFCRHTFSQHTTALTLRKKKISDNGYSFEIWRQPKMFYWQLSHCMAWLAWGAIPWHCDWCKNTLMRHSDWCKNTPMRQSVLCERHIRQRQSDWWKNTPMRQSDWCKNTPMRQSDWCTNTPVRKSDLCKRHTLMSNLIRTGNIPLCGGKTSKKEEAGKKSSWLHKCNPN